MMRNKPFPTWIVFFVLLLLVGLFIFPTQCKAETPQRWIVENLGLDGYSVLHYVGANWYSRARSSGTLNNMFMVETPTNWRIISEVAVLAVAWEITQYKLYGGWSEWCSTYGGAKPAKINALVDIGLGMIGGLIPLRSGGVSVAYNGNLNIEWRF